MSKGMLFSFEGQDATGKTTLIQSVAKALQGKSIDTIVVPEFSENITGRYIQNLLIQNKFIKFSLNNKVAYSITMLVINDLFYLHENEIISAMGDRKIILKDRYIDTIYACEIPKIMEDHLDISEESIYHWFDELLSPLYQPDHTFLLTLSLNEQKRRILNRGEKIEKNDISIFNKREKIYQRRLLENPNRIQIYNNSKHLDEATNDITSQIIKLIQ